jgi:serine/threonine protein kinase
MSTSFHIERCLGRGGFGEVYLASRRSAEGIDRKVAVKVLREDVSNPESAIARLKDEGRMLAMLDHPAIVQVVELTRLRGRIALVTEYVDGVDVARYATPGNLLPPRVVAELMGEVAGALHTASWTTSPATGKPLLLIHRDVKPENIRISRHGETKLLDFGIARTEEMGRSAHTTTGNVPFTAGYTAPETFVSLLQHPPSDVFAWGATLYRLLTGERFYGELKLTEQASLSGTPDRYARWLRQRLAALPAETVALAPLLGAALAYEAADRPTIGAVQEAVERVVAELPGPTIKRWARDTRIPEELPQSGGLVGQTVSEDRPGDSMLFARPVRVAAPPPPPRGTFLAPPVRESTTDRPPPPVTEALAGENPRWVKVGAGMVVALLALAGGLLLLSLVFAGMWLLGWH